MKTAKLIIENKEKFDNAVWQTKTDFNEKSYREWLKNASKTLQEIYDTYDGGADVYILGDVINMIDTIKVELNQKVSKVIFDVFLEGKKYTDVVLDFDGEVDDDYIHEEDGPWCIAEIGNEVWDCQVYGDENGELRMQLNKMEQNIATYEHTTIWLESDNVSNIRVKYM